MSTSEYYTGLFFFVVILTAIGLATELVVRRRLPQLAGTTRALAWATLATGGILVAHIVPAALTVLSRESAAATALLLLGGASLVPAVPRGEPVGFPPPSRRGGPIDRALATFGAAAFAIWLGLAALKYLHAAPVGFDAASAYLPTAARWVQDGSIWGLHDWLPNFFFGATPGNGTMLLAASMLPWDNDFLTHFAIYPFVALTALAIYGLARELGSPGPAAVLIGVALTAAPVVVQPALVNALLDPVLYATFATGALFLIRHHRTGEVSDLTLAGIALGIAFGTKFYGFTAVPILIAVWIVARLVARVDVPRVVRQALLVTGLVAALGGIWVVRNLVETGNPVYPVDVEVLGLSVFDAPEDPLRPLIGPTLADYFDDPGEWVGELRRQFRIATGIPLLLLAACVLGAVALLIRRRRRGESDTADGVAATAIGATVVLALSYTLTPYSAAGAPGDPFIAAANVRYGIPALIAAAAVAGWLAGRVGALGLVAFEALALAGMLDALRLGTTTPTASVYAAFGLAALGVAGLWLGRRVGWRPPTIALPPSAFALAAVVAITVLGILGARMQDRFNANRYLGEDPALDVVIVATESEAGTVGIAGSWSDRGVAPVYPSFGGRVRNAVDYVGPTDDGLLGVYQSRDRFVDALASNDYDLLVIGRAAAFLDDPLRNDAIASGEPIEQRWAQTVGFDEVARSERFVVMAPS